MYKKTCSYFHKFSYGDGKQIAKKDNIVKFPQKGVMNKKEVFVYAKIVDFEVDAPLPLDESKFFGRGNLRFLRLPQKVFGVVVSKVFGVILRALGVNLGSNCQ